MLTAVVNPGLCSADRCLLDRVIDRVCGAASCYCSSKQVCEVCNRCCSFRSRKLYAYSGLSYCIRIVICSVTLRQIRPACALRFSGQFLDLFVWGVILVKRHGYGHPGRPVNRGCTTVAREPLLLNGYTYVISLGVCNWIGISSVLILPSGSISGSVYKAVGCRDLSIRRYFFNAIGDLGSSILVFRVKVCPGIIPNLCAFYFLRKGDALSGYLNVILQQFDRYRIAVMVVVSIGPDLLNTDTGLFLGIGVYEACFRYCPVRYCCCSARLLSCVRSSIYRYAYVISVHLDVLFGECHYGVKKQVANLPCIRAFCRTGSCRCDCTVCAGRQDFGLGRAVLVIIRGRDLEVVRKICSAHHLRDLYASQFLVREIPCFAGFCVDGVSHLLIACDSSFADAVRDSFSCIRVLRQSCPVCLIFISLQTCFFCCHSVSGQIHFRVIAVFRAQRVRDAGRSLALILSVYPCLRYMAFRLLGGIVDYHQSVCPASFASDRKYIPVVTDRSIVVRYRCLCNGVYILCNDIIYYMVLRQVRPGHGFLPADRLRTYSIAQGIWCDVFSILLQLERHFHAAKPCLSSVPVLFRLDLGQLCVDEVVSVGRVCLGLIRYWLASVKDAYACLLNLVGVLIAGRIILVKVAEFIAVAGPCQCLIAVFIDCYRLPVSLSRLGLSCSFQGQRDFFRIVMLTAVVNPGLRAANISELVRVRHYRKVSLRYTGARHACFYYGRMRRCIHGNSFVRRSCFLYIIRADRHVPDFDRCWGSSADCNLKFFNCASVCMCRFCIAIRVSEYFERICPIR